LFVRRYVELNILLNSVFFFFLLKFLFWFLGKSTCTSRGMWGRRRRGLSDATHLPPPTTTIKVESRTPLTRQNDTDRISAFLVSFLFF
jgi:hypothetical protein